MFIWNLMQTTALLQVDDLGKNKNTVLVLWTTILVSEKNNKLSCESLG